MIDDQMKHAWAGEAWAEIDIYVVRVEEQKRNAEAVD